MIDNSKLAVVREYLRDSFKGCEVWDYYEFNRDAQSFGIKCRESSHLATISEEFFMDNDAERISALLKAWGLAQHLKKAGRGSRILVATTGIKQEKES